MDIEELIVVEGKNDAHAIRRALGDVDVLWTEGFGLSQKKIAYLREMAVRRGVIVCTDPDFAGKTIRDRISKCVPGVKHVYLPRKEAYDPLRKDIGIENASLEDIRKAFLKNVGEKTRVSIHQPEYIMEDLLEARLAGCEGARERRNRVGAMLGLGDTNAKQFLFRLNRFRVNRADFQEALMPEQINHE
ncbi:RNAse M5 [Syntrophobotulus glycolicus DSM 8271]|uniref:Ribonuclease M5 n=1 Tax=Syntrophobotulus glycolicus (strain DSM 8271 / FlGlyR) TaxID=645991 RepID=F0SW69_SYNGF|nr:ribonuclease M5 [Syntrophobotulus glycolicus]ADY54555.1 RNAse M5 [Syntrophobotulus glycolicus DSM 8271]